LTRSQKKKRKRKKHSPKKEEKEKKNRFNIFLLKKKLHRIFPLIKSIAPHYHPCDI
jgi:hypothetical protein